MTPQESRRLAAFVNSPLFRALPLEENFRIKKAIAPVRSMNEVPEWVMAMIEESEKTSDPQPTKPTSPSKDE